MNGPYLLVYCWKGLNKWDPYTWTGGGAGRGRKGVPVRLKLMGMWVACGRRWGEAKQMSRGEGNGGRLRGQSGVGPGDLEEF
jgi:hypothetical protein